MASDTKQKKKLNKLKPVPQKLRLFRAKEPVLSVFMWGINHTVSTNMCSISSALIDLSICANSVVFNAFGSVLGSATIALFRTLVRGR